MKAAALVDSSQTAVQDGFLLGKLTAALFELTVEKADLIAQFRDLSVQRGKSVAGAVDPQLDIAYLPQDALFLLLQAFRLSGIGLDLLLQLLKLVARAFDSILGLPGRDALGRGVRGISQRCQKEQGPGQGNNIRLYQAFSHLAPRSQIRLR